MALVQVSPINKIILFLSNEIIQLHNPNFIASVRCEEGCLLVHQCHCSRQIVRINLRLVFR